MDAQLKRGVLDVCVLKAIKNEDSYGYKIIKDVKPFLDLSESTLDTILDVRGVDKRTRRKIKEILSYYRCWIKKNKWF